jgi:hypothetical protein
MVDFHNQGVISFAMHLIQFFIYFLVGQVFSSAHMVDFIPLSKKKGLTNNIQLAIT